MFSVALFTRNFYTQAIGIEGGLGGVGLGGWGRDNHVRCCLQTNLMFFGVQRITFVVGGLGGGWGGGVGQG